MPQKDPSPQTTLVILLGASQWPRFPEFQSSETFANSARQLKAYLLNPRQFGLSAENVLDLFDADQSADDIDSAICDFLDQRTTSMKASGNAARVLLVYYVGHGGFAGSQDHYYLAIRRTRSDSPRASSIGIASLAETLKEKARRLRRFLILDCCFAAASFQHFQSGPGQAAIQKSLDAFKEKSEGVGYPERGTALLCSSGPKVPSLISRDGNQTMFTEALLWALITGNPRQQNKAYLSLRELTILIADLLADSPENAPRPHLHSPDQSEGDVADIPFFPNPRVQEERMRQVEEEMLRRIEEARDESAQEQQSVNPWTVQAGQGAAQQPSGAWGSQVPAQDPGEAPSPQQTYGASGVGVPETPSVTPPQRFPLAGSNEERVDTLGLRFVGTKRSLTGLPGLGRQMKEACGEEIRQERKVKGWSQEELAKQMKVFVSVVESWETGETLPDQDSLEELCKVFGKDICNFKRRTL